MRKVFLVLLLTSTLCISVGCKKKEEQKSLTVVNGLFTVGIDDSFTPISFRDKDNNLVGFDTDLAKEIAKRLNLKFDPVLINWASKEIELNNSKIDCIISGFSINPERAANMNLIQPYLNNSMVFIVNKDSSYKTMNDLKGKQIGVQAGSTAADSLMKSAIAKDVTMVEYELNTYTLNDLRIGRIAGSVMDDVVAKYIIEKEGANLRILDERLDKEFYTIAFKKGNDKLSQLVDKTISEMKTDGTLSKISMNWFGEDIVVK